MRWCVVHDAQEDGIRNSRWCWRRRYRDVGDECSLEDVSLEPMASMERTIGDDVPEGEGWHMIIDSTDRLPDDPAHDDAERWRLWSRTYGYRAVLPGWFDKDWGRIPVTEEF